ncbi:MAG: winged helix-turn-helix domain-containing protein [Deltaproteobacteria bacterium]|nr:winged helix-turn-helix domain-containing protein [Deltaproteobacteria bacterium]
MPRKSPIHPLRDHLAPDLFKALGDPNRLALLSRLAECRRECTVSELAECVKIDLSVVSRHLTQLRVVGVLEAEKIGKQVHYRLNCTRLAATLRAIADALDACCPPRKPEPPKG